MELRSRSLAIAGVVCTLISVEVTAQPARGRRDTNPRPISITVKPVETPPARELPPAPPVPDDLGKIRVIPDFQIPKGRRAGPPFDRPRAGQDEVVQTWAPVLSAVASPSATFEGISNSCSCLPPDPNGDIGPDHYVETVNLHWQTFDRSGTPLTTLATTQSLFAGLPGNNCASTNDGDPIVLYDPFEDRWILSQFSVTTGGACGIRRSFQCFAVSKTSDPTGSWCTYEFKHGLSGNNHFGDYPHFGVWPDGYYMTVNQFGTRFFTGCGFQGGGAYALSRDLVDAGGNCQPMTIIYFNLGAEDTCYGGQLASHLEGGSSPPSGSPNYFVQFDDGSWNCPAGTGFDNLKIWDFAADFTTPSNSTFGGVDRDSDGVPLDYTEILNLDAAGFSFDPDLCGFSRNCVPQQDGSVALDQGLDAISDRLMHVLQYRNFGSHEALVVNQTVDAVGGPGDHSSPRWYELRRQAGAWSAYQGGTFAPDSIHRWMGSAGINADGDILVGYSASCKNGEKGCDQDLHPSIRYAARLADDPLNSLAQGEATLITGTGSQQHNSNRWGDYSSVSTDPIDECMQWYTQEYYQTTSSAAWRTRVGQIEFPRHWVRSRGGVGVDALYDIRPTSSGGYIAAGATTSFGAGSADAWLLELTAGCGIRWQKALGGAGFDLARSAEQTSDGGFIVAGFTQSFGSNGAIWVLKLDAAGNVTWENVYDTALDEGAYSVLEDTGGNFVITGWGQRSGAGFDVVVLKLDSSGNILWQQHYGGTGHDGAYAVRQLADGDYLVGGTTASSGAGGFDGLLLKLNASTGAIVWQRTYGGTGREEIFSVEELAAGGLVAVGWTDSFSALDLDVWAFELTDDGSSISWQKRYDGTTDELAYNSRVSAGGDILIPVWSDVFGVVSDAWLMSLSQAGSGSVNWVQNYGGGSGDAAFTVQQTANGYLVAGATESFGAGSWDSWLVQTDANGEVGTSCAEVTTISGSVTVNDTSATPATPSFIPVASSLVRSATAATSTDTSPLLSAGRQCAAS